MAYDSVKKDILVANMKWSALLATGCYILLSSAAYASDTTEDVFDEDLMEETFEIFLDQIYLIRRIMV